MCDASCKVPEGGYPHEPISQPPRREVSTSYKTTAKPAATAKRPEPTLTTLPALSVGTELLDPVALREEDDLEALEDEDAEALASEEVAVFVAEPEEEESVAVAVTDPVLAVSDALTGDWMTN